jgi:hypothetical protein
MIISDNGANFISDVCVDVDLNVHPVGLNAINDVK